MLELVVAIAVLVVGTMAAFGTQIRSYQVIDASRGSNVIVTDLEMAMEEVVTRTADAIPGTFPEGVPMAAYSDLHLDGQRIVPAYPNYAGVGPVPDPLDIVLTATWTDGRGRPQRMTLATIKTR